MKTLNTYLDCCHNFLQLNRILTNWDDFLLHNKSHVDLVSRIYSNTVCIDILSWTGYHRASQLDQNYYVKDSASTHGCINERFCK